jgi:hypothetical protein
VEGEKPHFSLWKSKETWSEGQNEKAGREESMV